MSKEPDIKIEKVTLWTSICTHGSTHVEGMTALTEIHAALEKADLFLLDATSEDLELTTKKTNQK